MNTTTKSIQTELKEKGFVKIKYSSANNIIGDIASLGQVIFKTEIRENPSSTRLLSSNNEMGFHTDHYRARFIAWFCNSQSAFGGESLLIDALPLINQFSEENKVLLAEIMVKSHKVFYGDKLSYPVLNSNEEDVSPSIYYAPWLVNEPACVKHKKVLQKFESLLESTHPKEILLSEGDTLIIDNHRMLHGRNAFPTKSNRWLTRYWISDKLN